MKRDSPAESWPHPEGSRCATEDAKRRRKKTANSATDNGVKPIRPGEAVSAKRSLTEMVIWRLNKTDGLCEDGAEAGSLRVGRYAEENAAQPRGN